METNRCTWFTSAVAVVLVTMATPAFAQDQCVLAEAKAIAEEAYLYGFPMIVGYDVLYQFFIDRNSKQFKAPINQLHNEARVFTPTDTGISTPNSDTPYSMALLDLRAEPMVLCMPEIEKARYYDVQLVDLYTNNYGYMGSRATGNGAGCYMVAGPDRKGETPKGIAKVFGSETQFSLVIYRTQLFNPADLDNVKKVQAGYKIQPLSAFLGQPAPPAVPAIDWPKFEQAALTTGFAEHLDFLLQFCPPVGTAAVEVPLREKFARIGIGPGKKMSPANLTPEMKAALGEGVKAALAKIEKTAESVGTTVNGWQIGTAAGSRDFYKGNWALRAAAAKLGIYGNSEAEAVYPFTRHDANGIALDGSKHTYQMTFAAGQLPPVNAFWSITMYDGRTQLLIENPINRYLINSPMLPQLKQNADGSVTLYVQKDSPGKDRESNWLPAPDGKFILFSSQSPTTARDVWALPVDGTDRKPFPVAQTAAEERNGRFSPDGRWVAYESDETGHVEVFVRPFPRPGPAVRVSTEGGQTPFWRQDGKELYYTTDGQLMSVSVGGSGTGALDFGLPKLLFKVKGPVVPQTDGRRFLSLTPVGDDSRPPITVIANWAGQQR